MMANRTADGAGRAVVWHRTVDGAFSVKSAYEMFFIARTRFACAKPIWKSKAPHEVPVLHVAGRAPSLPHGRQPETPWLATQ
jgi:hypothetical protein